MDPKGVTSRVLLAERLALRRVEELAAVVRIPLRLTSIHPQSSKSYVTVPVDIEGLGFRNFLLDSGTSGVLVTPALRDALGISPSDGSPVKGLKVRRTALEVYDLLFDCIRYTWFIQKKLGVVYRYSLSSMS